MKFRKILALLAKPLALGYGGCLCCGMPWRFARAHTTWYSQRSGCFPLCRHCWSRLGPKEREPYYWKLWLDWQSDGKPLDTATWRLIRDAVRDGQ